MKTENRQWVSTSYSIERGGLRLGRVSGGKILIFGGSIVMGFIAIALLMAMGLTILLSLLLATLIPATTYLFLIWLSVRPEGYLEDCLEAILIRYTKHELLKDTDQNETFQ